MIYFDPQVTTHDNVQLQPDDDVVTKEGVIPKTMPIGFFGGEIGPITSIPHIEKDHGTTILCKGAGGALILSA